MNLLVTGALSWSEDELNMLKRLGNKVAFMQQESGVLPCEPEWVEGVIGNGIFLHHPIEQFTSLQFIQLTSAGFDRVPMKYVKEHDIAIYNARGVYSVPMAEFVLFGVLELYKQSRFFAKNQIERCWEKHRGLYELAEKTVCIVGCGSVGTECAKRFAAFECKVIGVDMFPYLSKYYQKIVPLTELEKAMEISDVIVLTLPLTEQTYHIINEERLWKIKQDAVLVNVARGAVVDTEALVKALESKLCGAVLDVFEIEPLDKSSPLWNMKNVILTPHNSFVGDGNHQRMLNVIYKNLEVQNGL